MAEEGRKEILSYLGDHSLSCESKERSTQGIADSSNTKGNDKQHHSLLDCHYVITSPKDSVDDHASSCRHQKGDGRPTEKGNLEFVVSIHLLGTLAGKKQDDDKRVT